MELRDVETFLILADELHFGRTAQHLRISQGRVSQTIRALEREVGGRLFERTSRHVALTPLGEHFKIGARRGYDTLKSTLSTSQRMARDVCGQVRIGYMPSIGLDFVAKLISAFRSKHPQCDTVFNAVGVRIFNLPEAPLTNAGVDVVLLWSPGGDGRALEAPGVTVGPILSQEPRGVLVPDSHALARREAVSLEDLVEYTLLDPGIAMNPSVRDLWTPPITPSGRLLTRTPGDIASMTGNKELVVGDIFTLVLSGRGLHCTIVSVLERFPCPGLTVIPIPDMPPMVIVPVWLTASESLTTLALVKIARTLYLTSLADIDEGH